MLKIKTENLTNAQLDHAVHIALGLGYREDFKYGKMYFGLPDKSGSISWDNIPKYYSSDWASGGPIIEKHGFTTMSQQPFSDVAWSCSASHGHTVCRRVLGPTMLVAGMRCFVVMKLGDEVEIPEDIK